MKREYKYCALNRPVGFATAPAGYIRVDPRPAKGEPHHETARHGIVVYDAPLSTGEASSFELMPILTDDELEALAAWFAVDYKRRAPNMRKLLDDGKRDLLRGMVLNKLAKENPRPSITDHNKLADRIIELSIS